MNEDFNFDVFLSHSSSDKSVVRVVAERLRKDGLSVWFDEWVLKPGDSIPAKIEEGLEHSRVLVLCMSDHAFGSDWAQLESGTFRFRDPLNHERRFIPLRLDDAPIKGSLAQFLYINWHSGDRDQEYAKLLEACRPEAKPAHVEAEGARGSAAEQVFQLKVKTNMYAFALSSDGTHAIIADQTDDVQLWDITNSRLLRVFPGHTGLVESVVWNPAQHRMISGCSDGIVRLWATDTGECLRGFTNKSGSGNNTPCLAWSEDRKRVLAGSFDNQIRLWDLETGLCLHVLEGHTNCPMSLAWNADETQVISGALDQTLRLWEVQTERCLRVFEGHTDYIYCVSMNNKRRVLSASADKTIRLWDLESGRCLRVLEGHKQEVHSVAWNANQTHALSGSVDNTVRLWDAENGQCLCVLEGHKASVNWLVWSTDEYHAFSCDINGGIRLWDLSEFLTKTRTTKVTVPALPLEDDQAQYTNAKVLLVGESGAGKTGLSKRLATNLWEASDSTVGAWATQWKLPVTPGNGVEREIWLWDFGGQADQRLIHQLYMDETALAVLVFDGQKEDLFETLGQWDRDLTRAARKEFAKLLVAGRVDAGGLRVSRSEVERFAAERKYKGFLETSAKTNMGCEDLKQAILAAINWDDIPCRTTELLFKRLKEEIIRLKDEGRVLMRFNELRETLQMRLSGDFRRFRDEELRAVLTLLAGPGVVWELAFGSWVLLQPERINAYAQAVIRTLQEDEHQRGCLWEEQVLKGDLAYESSMPRLDRDEERFILLAMHQTLVERGLSLRQPTAKGNLLIFPSYYRRERPDIVQYPAVLVNYRFTGFLDEIYATLVVRLHHTESFQQDQLWRYAADFKTITGKQLGVKLTRRAPGLGDLDVYFDPAVEMDQKITFSKFVHEHLLQHARDVVRLRHYVCSQCGTPVGNREVAMKRLNDWLQGQPEPERRLQFRKGKEPPSIICVGCEKRVLLWDDMEQSFASPDIQQRVRDMQQESAIVLSSQSKERALVGEVISTVALADQISREFNVSDQGIDMEIEFTDDAHEATGAKLYLQLKSGDSYLRRRKGDGAEIFTIKKARHARYWMDQAFPVLLVIRNAEGEVRWMEVRDWLKRASDNGRKPVKQIVFDGERFDVMGIRRWREKVLKEHTA